MDRLERYLGCLIGLAVGDTLGTTLEYGRHFDGALSD